MRSICAHRQQLCKLAVLHNRWDERFGAATEAVIRRLSVHFRAVCGCAQSEEITLLVAPPADHKLTTRSAALVRVGQQQGMGQRCARWQGAADSCSFTSNSRTGVYDTLRSALRLVPWRAYDCSVNAVSDAVHHYPPEKGDLTLPTREQLIELDTAERLELLESQPGAA